MAKTRSKKWIQQAIRKPGAFRQQAKRAGKSTLEFAREVLRNPQRYGKTTVRRARLAITLMKLASGGNNGNELAEKDIHATETIQFAEGYCAGSAGRYSECCPVGCTARCWVAWRVQIPTATANQPIPDQQVELGECSQEYRDGERNQYAKRDELVKETRESRTDRRRVSLFRSSTACPSSRAELDAYREQLSGLGELEKLFNQQLMNRRIGAVERVLDPAYAIAQLRATETDTANRLRRMMDLAGVKSQRSVEDAMARTAGELARQRALIPLQYAQSVMGIPLGLQYTSLVGSLLGQKRADELLALQQLIPALLQLYAYTRGNTQQQTIGGKLCGINETICSSEYRGGSRRGIRATQSHPFGR
jgi:hypothetical protein